MVQPTSVNLTISVQNTTKYSVTNQLQQPTYCWHSMLYSLLYSCENNLMCKWKLFYYLHLPILILSTYHYHYLLSVQPYCVATTHGTGFEKSRLPHTQQQDKLITIKQ